MLTLLFSLLICSADAAPTSSSGTELVSIAVTVDVIARYDAVRTALVADDLATAKTAAQAMATSSPGDSPVLDSTSSIAAAADLATARTAFSELSRILVQRISSASPAPKVFVYYCPMFAGYAYWLQPKAGLANPYMGQAMPGCGEETGMKVALKAANSTATQAP